MSMQNLYSIAIKELTEIYNNFSTIQNLINIKSQFKQDTSKPYGVVYNKINSLRVDKITNLELSDSSKEDLKEFIQTLELLVILDKHFLDLIKRYQHTNKGNQEYSDVKKSLLKNISDNSNYTNNNSNMILQLAIEDLFSNKYQKSNLKNMYIYFYYKTFAYISTYFRELLNTLADYFVRQICVGLTIDESPKDFINKKRIEHTDISSFLKLDSELIFLSYAFRDQLVSFLMFLEARSMGRVLFVDWMFSNELSNQNSELKENLSYFLHNSGKLVFLKSISSELNVSIPKYGLFSKNQKMVRQWCAWEIGHFYKLNGCSHCLSLEKYHSFLYIMHKEVYNYLSANTPSHGNILLQDIEPIESLEKFKR